MSDTIKTWANAVAYASISSVITSVVFAMEANVGDVWNLNSDGRLRLPRGWWLHSTTDTTRVPTYVVEFRRTADGDTSLKAIERVKAMLHRISEGDE